MSNKHTPEHAREQANSQLDALLQRGIQADKRATKPPMPTHIRATPAPVPTVSVPSAQLLASAPIQILDRLTIRFTKQEAELLEKARGLARAMGYKISDTAVFRLALNAFKPEAMTAQTLDAVLAADSRRRPPQ